MGEITRRLKLLARELNVPVVAMAQLNRDADNKEPHLGNLREAGSIEQDADTVILLHQEGEFDPTEPTAVLNLLIRKQRHGPLCKLKVIHDKAHYALLGIDRPAP